MVPVDLAAGPQTQSGADGPGPAVALLAGWCRSSPCVVPLLPGYLSTRPGSAAAEVVEGQGPRGRMLAGVSRFVLGFAVVFVITGVVAGSAGRAWPSNG